MRVGVECFGINARFEWLVVADLLKRRCLVKDMVNRCEGNVHMVNRCKENVHDWEDERKMHD